MSHKAAVVCETHRAGCPELQVGEQDLLVHSASVAEVADACAFVVVQVVTLDQGAGLDLEVEVGVDLGLDSEVDLDLDSEVGTDLAVLDQGLELDMKPEAEVEVEAVVAVGEGQGP